MPLILGFINANPVFSVLILLAGLTAARCGWQGHSRAVCSGLYAAAFFLGAVMLLALSLSTFLTGPAADFVDSFVKPAGGWVCLMLPLLIWWVHPIWAAKKSSRGRPLSKWASMLLLIAGFILAGLSLPGAARCVAWFI